MAKLKSLLKIEGTLDGMTFYKKDGKYWVKTKGGIESGRLKNDPAFARTRENNEEFKEVAKANKFFRTAWATQRADVKDNSVTYRLTSTLFKAIKQDLISARGARKIGIALETAEAKALLQGFNFNTRAALETVLDADILVDDTTKEVSIVELTPSLMLGKFQGATHCNISAFHANLNFTEAQKQIVKSNVVELATNDPMTDLSLVFSAPATGTGTEMIALKIVFLQEINGVKYSLNNGAFNILQLIKVS
ncbi:hypothetical protein [Polaribacter sp.]|uniref:hypothetical protein n=1 Tax=Polaribacter sp. TaxID=1920175 RepID=UPI004047B5ED